MHCSELLFQKMTGHRSLDHCVPMSGSLRINVQDKAVSKVLMGNVSYKSKDDQAGVCQQEKWCVAEVPHAASLFRVFGDLRNCCFGNLTVNINPIPLL